MRKLIESTLMSLDGVIGSPDRGAAFDDEAAQLAMQELDNYDAFLMGRVTYERLRALWAPVSGSPYIDKINAMPKHVASQSITELTWNATLLEPDIVGAIEKLKAQPGKDLIK
jgi:dihydrofolate reductase